MDTGVTIAVISLSWSSIQVRRTQALMFLVSRVWVQVLIMTFVSLSKTLNQY